MTEQRWSDRVGTPRICGLCGRRGFDVKRRVVCWSDPKVDCIDMDTCSADVERCRSIREAAGEQWPDGIAPQKPKLLPARAGGEP